MIKRSFDIREYKKKLRRHYKALRGGLAPGEKAEKDRSIIQRVEAMPQYKSAKTILCYVSLPQEVDTHGFIERALAAGKTVAVPYCVAGGKEMRFYKIASLSELAPGTFGVLEPQAEPEAELLDFEGSICILPGFSFDEAGYRLGYGGGYYDRFLSGVYRSGTKIGVCYAACKRKRLIHGYFDIPCDYVITEKDALHIVGRRYKRQKRQAKSPR